MGVAFIHYVLLLNRRFLVTLCFLVIANITLSTSSTCTRDQITIIFFSVREVLYLCLFNFMDRMKLLIANKSKTWTNTKEHMHRSNDMLARFDERIQFSNKFYHIKCQSILVKIFWILTILVTMWSRES